MLCRKSFLRMRLSMRRSLVCLLTVAGTLVLVFIYYMHSPNTNTSLTGVHQLNEDLLKMNDNLNKEWEATDGRLMTCQLHGRMGNMLFAYASLVGIARRNSRTPALPDGHFLRAIFRLRAAKLPARSESREKIREAKAAVYDDRTEWINSHADVVELVGYFQSWKYFARIMDEIRREFIFKAEYANEAVRFLGQSVADKFGSTTSWQDVVLVGVHVRVKDMSSNASLEQGYAVAPPSYISKAMDYFQREFSTKKVLFVLATDDADWCGKYFPFSSSAHIVQTGRGPDALDLAILSNCNHTILTVGTFGWWAGWLAGGRTVYYKNFPRPHSSLSEQYSHEDYFPLGWIAM